MIPTFNNKYLKYLFKNPEMETILPTHKAKKKKPQRKNKRKIFIIKQYVFLKGDA